MFTPRSSRDICERERVRIKRVHRILSYEYYIQCSCGYKAVPRIMLVRKCEAQIEFSAHSQLDFFSGTYRTYVMLGGVKTGFSAKSSQVYVTHRLLIRFVLICDLLALLTKDPEIK